MWLRKWPEPLCDLSPGLFTFGGLYYNPEHSIVLARSLFLHLLTSKSEELWIFLDVFILHLNFSKALGLCQTSCTVCARYLLIFPLFLHLCQVFELIFSSQSHKLHALVLCFFPKILFRLLASYTAIIGMNINSVSTFMFWLTMWLFLAFSSLVSLSSKELILIFWVFFSILPVPQFPFLILTKIRSLLFHYQIVYLSLISSL